MKKFSLILLGGMAVASCTFAQGFYLRASAGYPLPQAGQTLDGTGVPYSGSLTATAAGPYNYNIKKASFSAGSYLNVGGGYLFNEHIGIDGAFNIGLSARQYTLNVFDQIDYLNVSYVQKATSPLFFTPSVVLQTGGEKFNIYTRLGVVMPLNTEITYDEIISSIPDTLTQDMTYKIKSGFSLGLSATLGLQYRLNERIKLTGEVSFMSLSLLIKSKDLTALSQNGYNYPLTADSNAVQHTTYNINTTGVTASSVNQPAYTQPFSNLGFHFGAIFLIGNQGERAGKEKSRKGKSQNGYYHH